MENDCLLTYSNCIMAKPKASVWPLRKKKALPQALTVKRWKGNSYRASGSTGSKLLRMSPHSRGRAQMHHSIEGLNKSQTHCTEGRLPPWGFGESDPQIACFLRSVNRLGVRRMCHVHGDIFSFISH